MGQTNKKAVTELTITACLCTKLMVRPTRFERVTAWFVV
jgi:hypothetical protein